MTPISRWLRSAGICEGPFSEEAERGLEEIADYIAKDSPRRAVSFARELRDAVLALGDHPKAYPLIPRYEEYGQRRKAYRAYLII